MDRDGNVLGYETADQPIQSVKPSLTQLPRVKPTGHVYEQENPNYYIHDNPAPVRKTHQDTINEVLRIRF